MFKKVNTSLSFVQNEHEVEKYWKDNQINETCLKKNIENKKNNSYVFYDGPPTANGKPHIGHVETRAFKDLIPRFHAMRGAYVPRKAGWDTHGLPVELEVEKMLGINGKEQIESYGIAPFIEKCKENVWKYKGMWEDFSYKVAFNADMENPYVTYYNDYIESEWWALKTLFDKGLLYKSFKIVPYCPRCGTPLSSHEVAQGYRDIKTKTAVVRFKLKDKNEYFLAWTTTPWTLPSNLGLCVNPDYDYVKIKCVDGYTYILAKELVDSVLSCIKVEEGVNKYEILSTFKGNELVGIKYEPLYPYAIDIINKQKKKAFEVVADTYVTSENGTGIVHIAPAFGEDDNRVCQKNGIGFVQFVDTKGLMTSETEFAGKSVQETDPLVLKNLKDRNLLFDSPIIEHAYPHCWRCDTPLIYYARETWFIKMTDVKNALIENNNSINWVPENIGKGRFGDWLENVQDWGISRNRYWGTPLNIWECEECGNREAIGSIKELKSKSIEQIDEIELHRPYIDDVHIKCPHCGKPMSRVKEVIDCWFDSGAMPYAQHHYPFENKELFEEQFPATFISEAVDQTRGWFYSLLAESTLLFGKSCFKNCLVLGHVQDEHGSKMSKSKGNGTDPMEAINKYGSDATRYWIATAPIGTNLPYIEDEVKRGSKLLTKLWNASKYVLMNLTDFDPKSAQQIPVSERFIEDRWVLNELNKTIAETRKNLDKYFNYNARAAIDTFFWDIFCDQYLEFIKDRFWSPEKYSSESKLSAQWTLYTVLRNIIGLYAPFIPFITEELWQKIYKDVEGGETLHLTAYPETHDEYNTDVTQMNIALDILKHVRGLRTERKIGNGAKLEALTIPDDTPEILHGLIKSAARANKIVFGKETDFVVAQNNGQ